MRASRRSSTAKTCRRPLPSPATILSGSIALPRSTSEVSNMPAKLKAERREGSGKGAARKVRALGKVPAVVYGHGEDPLHVSVDAKELWHVLHTDAGLNVMIDVKVDGETFLAMPRQIQRDLLRDRFIHLDLLRIRR